MDHEPVEAKLRRVPLDSLPEPLWMFDPGPLATGRLAQILPSSPWTFCDCLKSIRTSPWHIAKRMSFRLTPQATATWDGICHTLRSPHASQRLKSLFPCYCLVRMTASPALPSLWFFTRPLAFSVGSSGKLVGAPQLVPCGLFARTLVNV